MIEWNTVKYIDCMDPDQGLPSLPDKSVDLCITDPPFNIEFKQKPTWINLDIIPYKDNRKDYFEWCSDWLAEVTRVSKMSIIHIRKYDIGEWYIKQKFDDFVLWFPPNIIGTIGRRTYALNLHLFIIYGKLKRKINSDLVKLNMKITRRRELLHPCPLNSEIINYFLKCLRPGSVIDPFLGSGTTAEVCTKLGIPWIGYEIMQEYSQDIEKRLRNCRPEPRQITLERLL